ncbi:hypothetical protein BH09SUM1_BH09SUM1_18360 [soil metagenome]
MAEEINDFRDLRVWQTAMDLSEAVYKLTKKFPPDEIYALTNQARRAVFPSRPTSRGATDGVT